MTTTVIKSITPAGGGDYGTLEEWATARAGILMPGSFEFVQFMRCDSPILNVNSGFVESAYLPIKPGTFAVKYHLDPSSYTAVDDGFGGLTGTRITSGSINYTTGEWHITFSGTVLDEGSGGNDWWNNFPFTYTAAGRDTIEIAEVYGGGNASNGNGLNLRGDVTQASPGNGYWATDATHYIEIRAASGEAHTGTWDTDKAYFSTSAGSAAFGIYSSGATEMHVNVVGMQVEHAGDLSDANGMFMSGAYIALNVDKCIIRSMPTSLDVYSPERYGLKAQSSDGASIFKNTIIISTSPVGTIVGGTEYLHAVEDRMAGSGVLTLYNCDLIVRDSGHTGAGTIEAYALNAGYGNGLTVTQNCYLAFVGTAETQGCYNGTLGSKGSTDATVNGEATSVKNVAFTTANFYSVTAGSENLLIKPSSALYNAGTTLGSVTYDIRGMARPQFALYDIGPFESDEEPPPICWNYTARYRNSNKLFKASGCGPFPNALRVPGNVDRSTGRMIDDGIEIDPTEYEII